MDVIERTDERTTPVRVEDGDHERFAHFVKVPPGSPHAEANGGGGVQALITEARILGLPVTALCGKVWVPERDPQRYPVCPRCKEIKDAGNAAGLRW